MKRIKLLRGMSVNGGSALAGAVVDVTDTDARRLLAGEVRAGTFAELVEDLGPDLPPPGTVEVEVLAPLLLCGRGCQPGERVWISKADASRLYGSPRVRFVTDAPVGVEDGARIVAEAAASRPGPLVRVSSGKDGGA